MGPAGPIGETGPQGEQGPQGEKGDTGGFSPKVYNYENFTVPEGASASNYVQLEDLSKEGFESSVILIYAARGINWIHLPGPSVGTPRRTYRVFYTFPENETQTRLYIARVDGGTAAETFEKLRIVVVPVQEIGGLQASGINLKDYTTVSHVLNLN